jgi:YjbE family integral membrane protein
MDPAAMGFWLPLGEISWIDILLSGDNAVVIALARRSLPEGQRMAGIILGSGAAIALRVAFTFLVIEVLGLPFVKIAGDLLLLWIAINLAGTEQPQKEIKLAESLWSAIQIIAMADAVMSLDNMLAIAAAAKGSMLLILFGLGLSIPLLISGSALLLFALRPFSCFRFQLHRWRSHQLRSRSCHLAFRAPTRQPWQLQAFEPRHFFRSKGLCVLRPLPDSLPRHAGLQPQVRREPPR